MNQNLLINHLVKSETKNKEIIKNIFLVLGGTLFLALVSQLKINLPYTPVPITGQTFAVLLIGLVYGRKLGVSTIFTYIVLGSFGLPVFANAGSGFLFKMASGGYILGFFFSILVTGYLADKGWTKSYVKLIITMLIAHFIIYFFGLIQLSLFVKNKDIIAIGFTPFIIGDIIKSLLVVSILPTTWKFIKK